MEKSNHKGYRLYTRPYTEYCPSWEINNQRLTKLATFGSTDLTLHICRSHRVGGVRAMRNWHKDIPKRLYAVSSVLSTEVRLVTSQSWGCGKGSEGLKSRHMVALRGHSKLTKLPV